MTGRTPMQHGASENVPPQSSPSPMSGRKAPHSSPAPPSPMNLFGMFDLSKTSVTAPATAVATAFQGFSQNLSTTAQNFAATTKVGMPQNTGFLSNNVMASQNA